MGPAAMTLRLVYPSSSPVERIIDHYPWPDPARHPRWVRGSMVSTVDGSGVGPDGRSGSISTGPDFDLFVALRNNCDVILVGAGTARAERYKPPRAARLAVVTGSGRLDPALPFIASANPDALPLIMTCAAADRGSLARLAGLAEVVECGDGDVSLSAALDELAQRGLRRTVVEGGPTLLGQLLADDLVDELDLQVTPLLVGGSFDGAEQPQRITAGPPLPTAPAHLNLEHILTDGATLFLRYTRAEAGHHSTREGH